MFREKFTSAVTLDPPRSISVEYLSGPLTHLKNDWKFMATGKTGCDLVFNVEFDFRSRIARQLDGNVFREGPAQNGASFRGKGARTLSWKLGRPAIQQTSIASFGKR